MSSKTVPEPGRDGGTAAEHSTVELHPAWRAFIQYCRDLEHGEIDCVKIQNGLPVSAEVIKKKIRWC